MLLRIVAALVLTGAALAAPAFAASQQDWDDCKGNDTDRSIAGCTRVIADRSESLYTRAQAYNYRGNAFRRRATGSRHRRLHRGDHSRSAVRPRLQRPRHRLA